MNIERLTELAKWLEDGAPHRDITFDMSSAMSLKVNETRYRDGNAPSECGASCCIAGAAVRFFETPETINNLFPFFDKETGRFSPTPSWESVNHLGRKALGLEPNQAYRLFLPNEQPDIVEAMEDIGDEEFAGEWDELRPYSDPAWAARVIRKLIATGGEVDWAGTYNPEPANA